MSFACGHGSASSEQSIFDDLRWEGSFTFCYAPLSGWRLHSGSGIYQLQPAGSARFDIFQNRKKKSLGFLFWFSLNKVFVTGVWDFTFFCPVIFLQSSGGEITQGKGKREKKEDVHLKYVM